MLRKIIGLLLLTLFSVVSIPVGAQHLIRVTNVTGIVKDSLTNEPISFASVFLRGSEEGVLTNDKGGFTVSTQANFINLEISAVGYDSKQVYVNKGQDNNIVVILRPSSVSLKEVVVKRTKEKYTKKGNPAVAFVEKLMARKKLYNPKDRPFLNYDKYEKMSFGFNDFSEVEDKNKILKKFKFLFDYMDTSDVTGKKVLPLSIKEKYSQEHFRLSPKGHKEYVVAVKHAGIDEVFDEASMKRFMDDAFREVDIFGNDISFMQSRFVSPLSAIGTNYYKYYLNDTVNIDGVKCVVLSFSPFTPQSFGFMGRIYVPVNDTTYSIKRVKMNVPSSINLNYVEHVYIQQDFESGPNGSLLKKNDDMTVEFKILPNTQGMYARRETSYKNYDFNPLANQNIFSKEGDQITARDANYMPDEFWNDNRPKKLKTDENTMKKMLARLRESKLFYWGEKIVVALVSGYIPTASKDSKYDIGPMNTTISGNTLEGVRLRLGGMTTANLDKHWFGRWYMAYGTRDEKLKYMGQLEYSFNKKKYHSNEFPIHSILLQHQYDVDQLGQHYMYTNMDNVFLALKRQKDDKMNYLRKTLLEYRLETKSGFSVAVGFQHNIHEATRFLPFEDGFGNVHGDYKEAGFNVTLRYAPHEKFYQTRSYRIPINLDAPILTLSHTYMPKGFMGSLFEVNKTEFGVQKRFWFSAFGYTDIILKAGKIWSNVSYPDLLIPNANLSYTIQNESYSLMNAMEFANDQYMSWDVTYWANGAVLNRIPLVRYLKLREVFSFRGLYGKLKDSNNPDYNNDLFRFPIDSHCKPMGKVPYMEAGVGLDNIFTFLRLDYVWRLTYRKTPGIDRSGIRVQLHFTF